MAKRSNPKPLSAPEPHRATVAAGFVTGLLSGARSRGLDADGLLTAAGLPLSATRADARISIGDYVTLYNTVARELGDEAFALFSVPLRRGTFEFLCRAMLGSRTLGEALDRAARFLRVVLPDLRITVSRDAAGARLEIAEVFRLRELADDPCRVFAFEWLLRLVHGLASWFAARPLALLAVRFPYARPAHASDYALIYTEEATFDAESLVAALEPAALDWPVRRDGKDLEAFLEGAPGKIAMLYRRDRDLARAVRELLVDSLSSPPSLDQVAEALGLSARTLHRRLQEEGTSFREVKDALRREIALARLERSDASVAEVAAELGYSEPSAFFRAFQQWTGVAPSVHRRRSR